jgi:hypothetical protein
MFPFDIDIDNGELRWYLYENSPAARRLPIEVSFVGFEAILNDQLPREYIEAYIAHHAKASVLKYGDLEVRTLRAVRLKP